MKTMTIVLYDEDGNRVSEMPVGAQIVAVDRIADEDGVYAIKYTFRAT
jgi:hypothetical protein